MVDGLWEKANKVSELGYKVHSVSNVAEMLGEALSHDTNSGVAWAIAEMLKELSDKLENLALDIMDINRAHEETKPKGKKK